MFTLNVRKLFRKSIVSWQTATPPRRKPRPTFRPGLEVLEQRCCLSGGVPDAGTSTALIWDPTSGSNASNPENWDVKSLGSGVHPAAPPGNTLFETDTMYFDGSQVKGNKSCTWDYIPWFYVGAVWFQNGWNQTLSFQAGDDFTIFDDSAVTTNSKPTLAPSGGTGAVAAINLTSNATFNVNSDCTLYLTGTKGGAIFFAGDGKIGERLYNGGTVTYSGVGQTNATDYLNIPVENGVGDGVFNVNGGASRGAGSTLQVSGTDSNTDNVSFYQNTSRATTSIYGGGTLWCVNNYTMNGGVLQTTDTSSNDTLKVGTGGSSPADGSVTLQSGTVNIAAGTNSYGTLNITGTTSANNPTLNVGDVTFNFKVNVASNTDRDQLKVGNQSSGGKVVFGYGGQTATIAISPQGTGAGGNAWSVILFNSVTNTGSVTISTGGYTLNWLPVGNPTYLEIDKK